MVWFSSAIFLVVVFFFFLCDKVCFWGRLFFKLVQFVYGVNSLKLNYDFETKSGYQFGKNCCFYFILLSEVV